MRKTMTRAAVLLMFLSILSFPASLLAKDMSDTMDEIKQLRETTRTLIRRIETLEKEVARYKNTVTDVEEAKRQQESLKEAMGEIRKIKDALGHLEISGGVTSVIQGTSGNDEGDATAAAFTIDLNLATHFGSYGSLYVHLEGGDGDGIQEHVPSFSIPNYDAYDTKNDDDQSGVTISEVFYEFSFFDDKLGFDIGKMDISVLFDENEVAGDETTQFLSNIFVKSMGMTIPEPDNFYCPAFMIHYAPMDLLEFRFIGASVKADNWDDLFSHSHRFMALQANFRPEIMGRHGNYRFYVWRDNRRHLNNNNVAAAPGRYNYSVADRDQNGWGLSFDQEITDTIRAFARYSQTEDDIARYDEDEWEIIPFDKTWSIGADFSGKMWNRKDDVLGIAFGQTILTDDYEKANNHTGDESYFEAYYRLALHERFSVSPDFQWIKNAGGNSRADDIYIFGIRGQLDF
jgi:hypothetical protein